jgi:probable HAF family extracellular repeat protein
VSVGQTYGPDGIVKPTQWTGIGQVEYLSGAYYAQDINDAGVVVGTSSDFRPYIFNGPSAGHLRELPSQLNSSATAISNTGIVVGGGAFQFPAATEGDPPKIYSRGIIWNEGQPTLLGVLPGHLESFTSSVSEDGVAGGHSATVDENGNFSYRAVLYRNGQVEDFLAPFGGGGPFSRVSDMNSRGDVVGFMDSRGAFLYRDGELTVFNELPEFQGIDLRLRAASGINDHGQIVGWGSAINGKGFAFLLTPVPEPETWALMAVGLVALGRLARRGKYCGPPGTGLGFTHSNQMQDLSSTEVRGAPVRRAVTRLIRRSLLWRLVISLGGTRSRHVA